MSAPWKALKNVKKAVSKKPVAKKKAAEKVKDDAPKLSAKEAFRAFVYDTLKNVFSLTARDDGDINVNIDNVTPLMKALELDTKDEAYIDMVHEACIESFGNININEFDETIMEQRKRATGEEFDDDFRSAFRLIDVDGDGVISVQDLYQLMMGIGEMLTDDELSELLKGADADGDGEVSYKDFRFFLTGEVLEEDIEPGNEDVDDETENVEPEVEVEDDNKADEVKPEEPKEEEKPEELTKEEEEMRAKKEVTKRKSLLWAFASQKYEKPVETKIPDIIKEIKKEKKPDIVEEDDKKDVDNDSEIASEPKPVTSVTVNYLESVKETDTVEHARTNQNQPNAALRRQSFSAMTSVDSGFDATDAEDIQSHINDQSESVTDDGFCSRATSARSRLTHDKSRISSAKSHYSSRPSTAKSIAEESFQDSEQSNELFPNGSDQLGRRSSRSTIADVENESDEESAIADECEFDTPLTERQLVFLKQREEQQTYCELGIERKVENIEPRNFSRDEDSLDLESVSQYDPNEITPRVNLSLLKSKHKKAVPILERSRSATRLRTFKKIQKVILVRQNTDPRMNVEHIKAANERFVREQKTKQQNTNTNGLYCTHISLDLNVESRKSPKPKMNPRYNSKNAVPSNTKVSSQQTSLRMLLKRPQTAMTYREAEKLNIVYGKNYDLNSPRSNFGGEMKIVDLAKSVTIDTGSIERPGLAHHHHGYKSVLPLGRVLSGYKSKINQGNGIILNSISRKLERIDYFTNLVNGRPTTPQFSQSMSTKQVSSHKQFSRSMSTQQVPQRQSIINLEIPEGARLSCRRQTQSTRFTSKPLIRT